jgi:phthalate 4,5-dioxygenase
MKRGHKTGFPQHLGTEDFAMFISQGPIYDRTKEQLCSADAAVMRVRHLLLRAAREHMEGKTPTQAGHPELDYRAIRSVGGVVPAGTDWRALADH